MTDKLLFVKDNVRARDGRKFFSVGTIGFVSEIPVDLQVKMIDVALIELTEKVTWVVFKDCEERYLEDNGRTCVYPLSLLDHKCKEKVYCILDNYGSVEALRKSVGDESVTTQYVMTMLLPEEY